MAEDNNVQGDENKEPNDKDSALERASGARFQSTFRRSNTPNSLDEIGVLAINNIVKGVTNFVNYINEVADRIEEQARIARERAEEIRQEEELRGESEVTAKPPAKTSSGFDFRSTFFGSSTTTPRRARSLPPSPFQSTRPDATNPGELPTREPMLDIFDEPEAIVVVAELPGVMEKDIIIEIHEDILILRAIGKTGKYEKESLLPARVDPKSLNKHYKNGMLELRLKRIEPPIAPESE